MRLIDVTKKKTQKKDSENREGKKIDSRNKSKFGNISEKKERKNIIKRIHGFSFLKNWKQKQETKNRKIIKHALSLPCAIANAFCCKDTESQNLAVDQLAKERDKRKGFVLELRAHTGWGGIGTCLSDHFGQQDYLSIWVLSTLCCNEPGGTLMVSRWTIKS